MKKKKPQITQIFFRRRRIFARRAPSPSPVTYFHGHWHHKCVLILKMKQPQRKNKDSISKQNNSLSRVEALSRLILDYLQKHPKASDTLEGIATWWLEQQRIEDLVEEVAEALELLVKKGTIIAHKNLNGTTIYKIKEK